MDKEHMSELQKQKQETEKLKKNFNRLTRGQKLSSRHLVEQWRDQAKTWMKTAINLRKRQKSPSSFEDVKEATKAYAEAIKELTMIPRLPDDAYSKFKMYLEEVYPLVFDYFKTNYPDILDSFLVEIEKIKTIRDSYFNPKDGNEKSELASFWKQASYASFEAWKQLMVDENGDIDKRYLDWLVVPFLEEPENIVADLRKANKAKQMVEEIEEVQSIERVKAQTEALRQKYRSQPRTAGNSISETAKRWREKATQLVSAIRKRLEKKTLSEAEKESLTQQLQFFQKALQAADSNIGQVFRDEQDKEVGEDSQKKRVASTTVDDSKKGKDDLEKEWLKSKKLYQGPDSDFQTKTLEERMEIILELFTNATLFLKKIDSQKDGQLYTQVQSSIKTAKQVYKKLKEENEESVKKAQKDDDDGEEEQDIQLLPHHPPQPQPFGPSSVGWYAIMMLIFIL